MQEALKHLKRFIVDRTGGTAVAFALSLPVLALAVGGGFDLSNAMNHRQKIANALEIACVQSAIEINYQIANGAQQSMDFGPGTVNPMAVRRVRDAGIPSGVTVRSVTTFPAIRITADSSSPAAFAQIGGLTSLPVKVQRECQYALPEQLPPTGQTLFVESFEQAHNVAPNSWTVLGSNGNQTSGASWNGWQTRNAGIEINGQPQLSGGTIRFGNFFAELDSHCYVSGCNSNSAMSRTLTLQPGNYQIGYWYISRIKNSSASWRGVVACSAKDTDAAVAPYRAWEQETNRIEVFVERRGDYTFAATNMVDVCVYSDQWIQRRVNFQVQTADEYRISWRAAGKQDTVGGLIDYLQLCKDNCS